MVKAAQDGITGKLSNSRIEELHNAFVKENNQK